VGRTISPLGDRVVVKPSGQEDVSAGGILLPDTAKERPQEGEVTAAGPGRVTDEGKTIPMDVKVGDVVVSKGEIVDGMETPRVQHAREAVVYSSILMDAKGIIAQLHCPDPPVRVLVAEAGAFPEDHSILSARHTVGVRTPLTLSLIIRAVVVAEFKIGLSLPCVALHMARDPCVDPV